MLASMKAYLIDETSRLVYTEKRNKIAEETSKHNLADKEKGANPFSTAFIDKEYETILKNREITIQEMLDEIKKHEGTMTKTSTEGFESTNSFKPFSLKLLNKYEESGKIDEQLLQDLLKVNKCFASLNGEKLTMFEGKSISEAKPGIPVMIYVKPQQYIMNFLNNKENNLLLTSTEDAKHITVAVFFLDNYKRHSSLEIPSNVFEVIEELLSTTIQKYTLPEDIFSLNGEIIALGGWYPNFLVAKIKPNYSKFLELKHRLETTITGFVEGVCEISTSRGERFRKNDRSILCSNNFSWKHGLSHGDDTLCHITLGEFQTENEAYNSLRIKQCLDIAKNEQNMEDEKQLTNYRKQIKSSVLDNLFYRRQDFQSEEFIEFLERYQIDSRINIDGKILNMINNNWFNLHGKPYVSLFMKTVADHKLELKGITAKTQNLMYRKGLTPNK